MVGNWVDRRVAKSDDLTVALKAVQMVDEMAATMVDWWAVELVELLAGQRVAQMVDEMVGLMADTLAL